MISNIIYAVDSDGNLAHVDNVPNGIKCGCRCPGCGEALIARNNGKKQAHHFAHTGGAECAGGYQTSLHLLAKDIILSKNKIFLPAVSAYYTSPDDDSVVHGFELYVRKALFPSQFIEDGIERVELEKGDGCIIPDVTVYFRNGSKLYVEIYVTHEVDEVKRQRIIKNNISCIEVNLSKEKRLLTREELAALLYDKEFMEKHCKWIYNRKIAKAQEQYKDYIARYCQRVAFKAAVDRRSETVSGYTYQCPRCGYQFLYGKNLGRLGCAECDCNHGIRANKEDPSSFEALCSYNILQPISDSFGFGWKIEKESDGICFLASNQDGVELHSKFEPISDYCYFHNAQYFKDIKKDVSDIFFGKLDADAKERYKD